jgi:hypothetical protein
LSRHILVVVLLVRVAVCPAAAQQPLGEAPVAPEFLPRYDFHLSAAALVHADERFSWDTHWGGDIDVFDYVAGRVSTFMDYQAVLGNEFRPFDPNQGNYILEVSASGRLPKVELAGIFHHVSRHLGDRPKIVPIAWNVLGVRALRRATFGDVTLDVVADFGGVTQRSYVDYRWMGNAGVVVRRQLRERFGVYARGGTSLAGVGPEYGRGTQAGALVEGGVRLGGGAGLGELFAGFERRFDADPFDMQAQRWLMIGFRVLRR